MTVRRHRALQAAGTPVLLAGDGRTVRIRVVAWDTPSTVTDDGGRTWYREQFSRGGLQVPPATLIGATAEHAGEPVGKIVAAEETDDGLYADVRMSATGTADDQLALIDDGLLSVSVEFDDNAGTAAAGELVTRTDAVVTGIAFTHYPQHTTAAVIGRRSHKGDKPMTPEEIAAQAAADAATAQAAADAATSQAAADQAAADAAATEHARSHAIRPGARPDPALTVAQPSAFTHGRFRSLGDFVQQAASGQVPLDERRRYYRALSAATTADITGLLQVQWINEVIDLIRPSMPTVQAFAQRPLPDSGTTISRPIVVQRPAIAKQTTQNAAVGAGGIGSNKVTIVPANWTVDVYGGGQEMSLTTLLRSDPAYLDQVIRLYAVEMARKVETDVAAAVLAAADDVNAFIELPNTAANYQDAFIDAADVIMGGIDRLPTLAVINRRMWVLLAKALDTTNRPLFPGVSLFNPQGSMSITTTDGEVRGLSWFVAPKMDNTRAKAVVGVPEAFETMLGPVQTVQNDVPETLTHQHAVFQFVAFGKTDASGLVLIDNAV